jgi:hypothetical protein
MVVAPLDWKVNVWCLRVKVPLGTTAITQPGSVAVECVESDSDGVLFGLGGFIGWDADQTAEAGCLRRVIPCGLTELERTHVEAVR